MRILVTAAAGFIGSAIVARLQSEGHETVSCVRNPSAHVPGEVRVVDFATATQSDWLSQLADVDAVVNCVGVLQDSVRDSTEDAHASGAKRLFNACERAGVRKVIHFSAAGADKPLTKFSETKHRGDQSLMASRLDWIVLRPSVVVGPAAYGGSALFRGLAAMPVLPLMPATGPLQIVQLSDVVETVLKLLQPEAPSRLVLEVAGPERLEMRDVVGMYRSWLGWKKQPIWLLPSFAAAALYKLGDFAGWLGWRPPLRSTARLEIARGATGDTRAWTEATGIVPQSLPQALRSQPASVQEHWFARLYFLKPIVFGVLSLFWIGTGLISLGPGWPIGMDILRQGGVGDIAPLAIAAGALADIAIGVGIAFRRTARLALYAGVLLSLAYAIIGTVVAPQLWSDPLGPMFKIWPIIVLLLVALAIRGDR